MQIADLSEPVWDLLFDIRRSIRYHDHRRRFFTAWQRVTSWVGVMLGSTATATLIGLLPDGIGIAAAVGVTLMSSLDLVIGFGPAADRHRDLKRRFIDLEMDIIRRHEIDALGEHQRRRLEIEKDEPPVLRALDTICFNEIVRAEHSPADAVDHFIHVTRWQRLTAQFLSHASAVPKRSIAS